jgi:hypothetical protein
MGDDIGSGLSSMAVCFDFHSTNIVQLSNQNLYLYRFRCHHPLITQLSFKVVYQWPFVVAAAAVAATSMAAWAGWQW